jgi:dCMP deaminase
VKQLLLYLPVLHSGYESLFARHSDADAVLLLGDGFRQQYPSLAKDIRALPPGRAARYARVALPEHCDVRVIEPCDLPGVITADTLVMPDERVTRRLAAEYKLGEGDRRLLFEKTFLRWDRNWSRAQRPARFDGAVAPGELPRGLVTAAQRLAGLSSDWWRQVGAIAVRDGRVLGYAWNRHHPTEYSPYIDGDPRDNFSRGVRPDLSSAIHAEAAIIAEAARDGIGLGGADLYATTFPCPACARLIAEAKFRRCFFAGPYSVLAGEDVLRAAGVEVLWVDLDSPRSA